MLSNVFSQIISNFILTDKRLYFGKLDIKSKSEGAVVSGKATIQKKMQCAIDCERGSLIYYATNHRPG
jgi:hypothetical protein